MNLWHDIEPGTKDEMNVIIEIPRGSKNKYEIDKETGLIALDRVMHTAQDYPVDYGFVPKTLWDDNDALDVIVLTTYPLYPGVVVRVRPIGILNVIDGGEGDDKVIGVPSDDPRFNNMKDLGDVNKHQLQEIIHFFETYKNLQDKVVEVKSQGNAEEAKAAFVRGRDLYNKKFGK